MKVILITHGCAAAVRAGNTALLWRVTFGPASVAAEVRIVRPASKQRLLLQPSIFGRQL